MIGRQYWVDPDLASQLYAPADWTIVNQSVFGTMAVVTVRVNSSTKGGVPIRKLWSIYLRYREGWKVSLLTEDQ